MKRYSWRKTGVFEITTINEEIIMKKIFIWSIFS